MKRSHVERFKLFTALFGYALLAVVIGRFLNRIMKPNREITSEQYAEIIAMKPEERTADFGDGVTNRIIGILIAYSKKYDLRDGWNDIITTGDAEKEIKQLICDCNGDLNAL